MNGYRHLLSILCVCLLGMTYAAPALAVPALGGSVHVVDEDAEPQTWNLKADKLTNLGDGVVVEAEGNVFMQRGVEYLKADFARYYPSTNWVYLRGNVDVRMGKDTIKSEQAEFDLRSRTGWLTNGNIFMEGPHMYFRGNQVVKHRGDRYTFQNAKITTCDGDVPAWSMTAEQAMVEIDGYARLYGSTFQIADQAVIGSPFMIVPAKTSRQSGLLTPDYGYGNKRGAYMTIPYFHVIDESRDMTFYATEMTKMGFMGSAQYRSQTTAVDKTWLMGSALSSQSIVRNPSDDPTGNKLSRTNWNRYWLRGMSDGHVGATPWKYRLNLDYVSDQNFVREFSGGPVGFDSSRDETFNMFGRDLREDDQKRLSAGVLYRDWERVGMAMSMRYEQDAGLGHGNMPRDKDETVQQLPRLDMFLYKGRVFEEVPLEFEAQANSAYMYRRSGTKGMRSELYPRASLPLDLKYASFIGTVGWRQTLYNTATISNTDPLLGYTQKSTLPRQTGSYRSLVDLDLQLFTEADRIWKFAPDEDLALTQKNVGKSTTLGLRHQIQPRLSYKGQSREDQINNPFYSMDDRMIAVNELRYSVTNIITRKTSTVTQLPPEKKGDAPTYGTTEGYQELMWWKLEAGYDYEEASRTQYRDLYKRRPLMDIYSELEISPLKWFAYNNKLYISPYDGELSRYDHSVSLRFWDWMQWSTGLSVRTKDYEIRQRLQREHQPDILPESPLRLLNNGVTLNVTDSWSLMVDEYRNLRTNDVYDREFRLAYSAQCYKIIARMTSNDTERSFGLFVELPGLFE